MEVLCSIQFWRNKLAPINRIPPEVLILIPDSWDEHTRSRTAVALTHVCRAWRELFTSCSSLWTDFDCADAEKTRVYLERSRSSPIKLWLERSNGLLPRDPFLQIAPHAVNRLKYLFVETMPDHLQGITDHLSYPAPLLKDLTILGSSEDPELNSALATTLFDGDLSSLHALCLQSVRTQLPWRNMVNLTSFSLIYVLYPRVSVGQLLDFFESAPYLLDVKLIFATPNSGAQNGRLVSLGHLRTFYINGFEPPSLLLDHLLIPAGVKMTTDLDLPGPLIEDHLPRSLDNLGNLSGFTKICLQLENHAASVKFTGPNGEVTMASSFPESDATHTVPRSLAQLDTSKTKRLEVISDDLLSEDLQRVLLLMENLRSLTLSLCKNLPSLILALYPDLDPVNPIICPKLARLVFRTGERFCIKSMVAVAAARASRGAPLKFVRIICRGEPVPGEGVMELLKHVLNVETVLENGDNSSV